MTQNADQRIGNFIQQAGWENAARMPLAGDASSRRYERLQEDGRAAILMIDPSVETVQKFLDVTKLISKDGYSVPEILHENVQEGLLLLEDFGDQLFTQLIEGGADASPLYALATDFLLDLRTKKLPEGLPYFSPSYVLDQNTMFLDWYIPEITGQQVAENAQLFYQQIWRELLASMGSMEEVLLLRDFHAENTLFLEGRTGLKSLGLLDYQDAMVGPAAYDLVSLLQDARRDVGVALEQKMINRYAEKSGADQEFFRQQYAILGAHRALRIMGIFTRLSKRDGKSRYQAFMPRMKRHLKHNLEHPALMALQHWLKITVGKDLV